MIKKGGGVFQLEHLLQHLTTQHIKENDREFGKGIEAHPAPDMSKQLEALQLAHTLREKAGQFTHLPQSTIKAL